MVKRVLLVAIVLAAILVVAAPALAFNGYRADYTVSADCALCHTNTPGIPQIYDMWSQTGHAKGAVNPNRSPYGSSCAGCHAANYDPNKVVPTPTATATSGAVSWAWTNGAATAPQATGNAATSETAVGCSSCHYNQTAAHAAGAANPSNMANAEICGQCHIRYSYSVDTYAVPTLPYTTVTLPLPGTPVTPNPNPTSLLQPQYAIGLETMGNAANGWTPQPLSDKQVIQTPGWTPSPTATKAAGLMHYWQLDGVDTVWQYNGHDGSASQYPEWANEGHRNALDNLKAVMGPNPPASCLECHSTDYRIAPEDAKPTGAEAKYGITCVGCHTPHEKGTATGAWSEEWMPQLRTDSAKTLCVECHNAELDGKVAKPGSTVHHPMKEMMNGTGAIDVPQGSPSVHKGKCVECHMPPTSTSPTGANHTFKIIEPEVAAEAKPHPDITNTPTPTMPFSACTTCHSRTRSNGTVDKAALWLQDTLDDRQEAMLAWNDQVTATLTKAAKKLGFKSTAAANAAINKKPMKKWSKGQMAFQKSFTNQSYVVNEGSWGIHSWDYARTVILTALSQARSVKK